MELENFNVDVMSFATGATIETLKVDNNLYKILGAVKGELEARHVVAGLAQESYFALILVNDSDGNQYLISTQDNTPMPIVKGTHSEYVGCAYGVWKPNDKFYIDRLRTRLIREDSLHQGKNDTLFTVTN